MSAQSPFADRATAVAWVRDCIDRDDRFFGANRLVLIALLGACDFKSFKFAVKYGRLMEWVASEADLHEALRYLADHDAIAIDGYSEDHVGGRLLLGQRAANHLGQSLK